MCDTSDGGAPHGRAPEPELWLPRRVLAAVTEARVCDPGIARRQAGRRRRREAPTRDGRLVLLACDHPARRVTACGDDPLRMANRGDYLARIVRVLSHDLVDGVMSTPDIIEDLLILDHLLTEGGARPLLDDRLVIGCLNRGGLAGTIFELDDRMTAFTPEALNALGLDGAKMMWRLDPASEASGRAMQWCADAISQCAALGLTAFLEALPARWPPGGLGTPADTEELVQVVGVASALGTSSTRTWLKLPYVAGYERVAAATTLPILMLGGEARTDSTALLRSFELGMRAGPNVRGVLVGRNVLYPGDSDPLAMAAAVGCIVHRGALAHDVLCILSDGAGDGDTQCPEWP